MEPELKIGSCVQDLAGHIGIVVKIIVPDSEEFHGSIYVWQRDRFNYGADNCEHYPFSGWCRFLKVLH